jgi:hypothetical protein
MKQGAGQAEAEGIFTPDGRIQHEAGQLHRTVPVDLIERDDTQGKDVGEVGRLVDVTVDTDLQDRIVDQPAAEARHIEKKCGQRREQSATPRRTRRADHAGKKRHHPA